MTVSGVSGDTQRGKAARTIWRIVAVGMLLPVSAASLAQADQPNATLYGVTSPLGGDLRMVAPA
jgi:hypothetical protein